MAGGKLKALISTHHCFTWAGSELVSLELIEELQARGVEVTLYCPFVDFAFVRSVLGGRMQILFDPDMVDLAAFDFVVIHHQTAARYLPNQSQDVLFGAERPVLVYNHMSPHEPFEQPGPFAEALMADIVLCNSVETAQSLARLGPPFDDTVLFPNPAPAGFERAPLPPFPKTLRRLLSVTNHPTIELREAFELLRDRGVEVTELGLPHDNRRLLPTDLWAHDAVVTIGKTVQYALRGRMPVFCYDIHQGPGWLSTGNFARAADHNFSGRCTPGIRTGAELADDVQDGFLDAVQFANGLDDGVIAPFRLESQVTGLLTLIEEKRAAKPRRGMTRRRRSDPQEVMDKLEREAAIYGLIDREFASAQAGTPGLTMIRKVERPFADLPVEAKLLRPPEAGKAMVVAAFSFRYDAHLVPGLLENLAPSVHAWVAYDDRKTARAYTGDANRQAVLHEAARRLGADWILATDPDERFEGALAKRIDGLVNDHGPVCWTFNCREMFTPTAYRSDGLWRVKPRARLFPCLPGMQPDGKDLHGSWTQNAANFPMRDAGIDFYHLRMATPARRKHRRDLYAAADPERAAQAVGYDYLDDERGMQLCEIAPGREYTPPFVEDHGLWAPAIEDIGRPRSDPARARFHWGAITLRLGDRQGALHGIEDAFDMAGGDPDLGLLAAGLALEAGEPERAARICDRIAGGDDIACCAAVIRSRALTRLGDGEGARAAARAAVGFAPDSREAHHQRIMTGAAPDGFADPQAPWRQWARDAAIHEGAEVARAPLAVVVLGLGAPAELADAVASLREQDCAAEIVVVNSGGGDARAVLAAHLDHIRLIEVEERLFPGAARNIGIDASTAPFVGFLASDCRARPGWVRLRREHHERGAEVVSSTVLPDDPDNLYVTVSSAFQHWTRWPDTPEGKRAIYGNSYARSLFEKHGYFPAGLRVGEDTYFNSRLPKGTATDWVAEIQTEHVYPKSLAALSRDMFKRGYRRADHAPFNGFDTPGALRAFLYRWIRTKNRASHEAVLQSGRLAPERMAALVRVLRMTSRAEVLGVIAGSRRSFRLKALQARADEIAKDSPERALALYAEAGAMMPGNAAFQLAQAERLMALAPDRQEEILAALRKAVAADPRNRAAQLRLLGYLDGQGQRAEALRAAEDATRLVPDEAEFWVLRAGLARKLGRDADALYCLHRWLRFKPEDPEAHDALAGYYRQTGNTAQNLRRETFLRPPD